MIDLEPKNRVYDASTDRLDSGSPGFVVVADAPPTPSVPVPAIARQEIARQESSF